jgi:7-cyano-7-deazaguanine synthase
MQKKIFKKSLVVFSGGQDSTTCLNWAINRSERTETITFVYGQKHLIEVEQSKKICEKHGVKQTIIDLSFLDEIVESALTSNGDVNKLNAKGLPDSFVPNRNQLFLTLAHAYAQKIGCENIIIGVCETDFSGYPDCRNDFIKAIEKASNLGSAERIRIHTPLMYLNKAETFELADSEGCLNEVIKESHTCYNGERNVLHVYGYGCDNCPACKIRKKGYEQFLTNKMLS